MGIINAESGKTVRIAYQGENLRTRVRFDLADIMTEYPGGTAVLAILRKGDAEPVPAAECELDRDGMALYWTVTAWECAVADFVYAQVTYAVENVVAKTKTYRFDVKDSLVVGEAEEETWQDLVGQLVTAADGVNAAIAAAEETLAAKVAAAEAARSAAEDAQGAAAGSASAAAGSAAAAAAAVASYDAMTAEAEALEAGKAPTAAIDHSGEHPVLLLGIPAGEKGDKGEKGDTGATGARGDKGEKGDKGDTGAQGPKGDTGATGPQGPKGDPGEVNIDDTAGAGDTDVTYSADKLTGELSDLKSAIDVLDISKAPVIISNASGAVASFSDGANNAPVKSLVAKIEPVQDLHGYDSPWPAGGGVNVADFASYFNEGETFTENGITAVFSKGYLKVTGTNTSSTFNIVYKNINPSIVLPAGTYIMPYYLNIRASIDGGARTDYAASITAETSLEIFNFYVFVSTGGTADYNIPMMLVKGTTRPTEYSPYENICPITGFDSAKVQRCGKNLLNPKLYSGGFYNPSIGSTWNLAESSVQLTDIGNGQFSVALGSWSFRVFVFDLKDGQSYRFKCAFAGTDVAISHGYLDGDYTVLSKYNETGATVNKSVTFTGSSERKKAYVGFAPRSSTQTLTLTEPQLELGSTATAYEPYQGSTYPITWEEAGTVYGGTVNPVTGELVVDRACVTYDGSADENWSHYTVISGELFRIVVPNRREGAISLYSSDIGLFKSNSYKPSSDLGTGRTNGTFSGSSFNADFINNAYTAVDAWKSYIADNNIQFCYPLATPITYQLTPTEVRTLLGQNNIWADTGDVSVDYRADTKLYIDNKITQAIAAALNS